MQADTCQLAPNPNPSNGAAWSKLSYTTLAVGYSQHPAGFAWLRMETGVGSLYQADGFSRGGRGIVHMREAMEVIRACTGTASSAGWEIWDLVG